MSNRKKIMLGQFFNHQKGRFGSVYENEMQFHMFTRNESGLCALCDLQPSDRTNQGGYKLPGNLFHSKANQFEDPNFPDWQSDKIYVKTNRASYAELPFVFRWDTRGNFPWDSFGIDLGLRTLSGAEDFSSSTKDFLCCQDYQLGLRMYGNLGYIHQEINGLPSDRLRLNLADLTDHVPIAVIDRVNYGYLVLAKFKCPSKDSMSINVLEKHVERFGDVIEKSRGSAFPQELGDVKNCTITVRIGNLWEDYVPTQKFASFRSAYDHIRECLDSLEGAILVQGLGDSLHRMGGRGVLSYSFNTLTQYEDFEKIGRSDVCNWMQEKILGLPRQLTAPSSNHVGSHNVTKLVFQIALLNKQLENCVSDDNGNLKRACQYLLKQSQEKLGKALDSFYTSQGEPDCIEKVFDEFSTSAGNLEIRGIKFLLDLESVRSVCKPSQLKFLLMSLKHGHQPSDLKNRLAIWLEMFPEFDCTINYLSKPKQRGKETTKLECQPLQIKFLSESMQQGYKPEEIKTYLEVFLKHFPDLDCTVSYSSEPKQPDKEAQRSQTLLGFPCPCSWDGGCPKSFRRWRCSRCGHQVFYSHKQGTVNCPCGIVPYNNCGFRCSDPKHGIFPNSASLLQQRMPRAEINCILLGETGSGKSTLINSIGNYRQYTSLAEAFMQKPVCLIPTAYSKFDDETDDIITIPYGQDENEEVVEGRTCTLNYRNYIVPLEDQDQTVLRFVDSPGIDPESKVQEFARSVLEVAALHGDIHAFCWVIDASHRNLTEPFKSAFTQLTSALTSDQQKNFVFVITHHLDDDVADRRLVRQIKLLFAHFNPDQVFKMNNEAFPTMLFQNGGRAIQGYTLPRVEHNWIQSSEECGRLFEKLCSMEPCVVLKNSFLETVSFDPLEEDCFEPVVSSEACMIQGTRKSFNSVNQSPAAVEQNY